ncbi:MAG: 1,4-beta-xylanase [Chitinivibrionales bacterium]|nr:1,4-beta-xylanase [Chitinivibrionales bacterium]
MQSQSAEVIANALGHEQPYQAVAGQWPKKKAQAWYDELPWLAGTNYYPATAINQIEMWQDSTWDPTTIDKEMGWAEELGFNTHRVYLHDLVWADDEEGLYARMDEFLAICGKHGIRPFFVFFDDCHFPVAQLGPQSLPVPGYHNSGWVTCPQRATAVRFSQGRASADEVAQLRGYIHNTIKRFADDQRVLMWELYNEPGRGPSAEQGRQGDLEDPGFGDGSARLVHESWVWARAANPSQPICSNSEGCVGEVNRSINILNSDVHSIHAYCGPVDVEKLVLRFAELGRPIFMTEYLAREFGSTFQDVMPVLKKHEVAAINWGFVAGKSGTVWNWASRQSDGTFKEAPKFRAEGKVLQPGEPFPEPELWFHDVLRTDGTPFSEDEVACIKQHTLGV